MKINFMMNLGAIQPREAHQSSVYGAQTKSLDIYLRHMLPWHFQLGNMYMYLSISIHQFPSISINSSMSADLIFMFFLSLTRKEIKEK